MQKVFQKYPQTILVTLAVIFLGLLLAYFSWGIGEVVGQVNRAANASGNGENASKFDLQGAQGLDLRGLVKP